VSLPGTRIKVGLARVAWGLTEVLFLIEKQNKQTKKNRNNDARSLITLRMFNKKIILKPLPLG